MKIVSEKVERYRDFRAALKQLKDIEKERYALLKGLMDRRNELYE